MSPRLVVGVQIKWKKYYDFLGFAVLCRTCARGPAALARPDVTSCVSAVVLKLQLIPPALL